MQLPTLVGHPVWLSEHYWPGLTDALVLAHAQRTALVRPAVRWVATLVLPGEQTAMGVFAAPDPDDVADALVVAGCRPDRLSPALHVLAAETPLALTTEVPR